MKFRLFALCCILQLIHGFSHYNSIDSPEPGLGRAAGGDRGYSPFTCSLRANADYFNDKKGVHFCGCSIIDERWILTTASCVQRNSPQDIHVLVGTPSRDGYGGVLHPVTKIIAHERFNQPKFANDIALLYTRIEIEFNERTHHVIVARADAKEGAEMELSGWGIMAQGFPPAEELHIMKSYALTTTKCKDAYDGSMMEVHDSHFCSIPKLGEGPCQGDAGDPVVRRLSNFTALQVGIVSWAVIPCASGWPDGFTKLSYFFNWIESNTRYEPM